MKATIYHNPHVRNVAKDPRNPARLGLRRMGSRISEEPAQSRRTGAALRKAGISPRKGLRAKEPLASELGLNRAEVTDDEVLDAMLEHPILIERPLVETPKGVRLCRPAGPGARDNLKDCLAMTDIVASTRACCSRAMRPASSRWPTAARPTNCSGSSRATARSCRSIASMCRARFDGPSRPTGSPSRSTATSPPSSPPAPSARKPGSTPSIERAMLALHASGHAHSVEVWDGRRAGRRPLRRQARPRLLRRKHVQPRDRRVEGRARLAGRAPQGREFHDCSTASS